MGTICSTRTNGNSSVHVVSANILDDTQVRDAVDDAGYELVDAGR